MADGGEQLYGNILLGSRGGATAGSLKVSGSGLVWKRSGGGRTLEIATDDISGLSWTKASRGSTLSVRRAEGPPVAFMGFKDKDVEALRAATNRQIADEPLATSGHNWGHLSLDGPSLAFRVGGRTAFHVPLPEVSQAQQGRDEVMLEFPVDDTVAGAREDTLVEMSFFVPRDNEDIPAPEGGAAAGGEEGEAGAPVDPPAKRLFDFVSRFTDAGAATGDAVATFDQVGVLVPRGRFDIEMYLSSLKLVGQAQDYRIQYDSIVRVFLLPKANVPQTLVVISLDPPIRKGQTFYNHILCQFPSDEEAEVELDIGDEALAAKNEKCGGRLARAMRGPAHEVFAKALRGLSGAKLTKPGTFRDAEGTGHAVRCSFKADDGHLYPLERAFFYVQKPPLLIVFDDVEAVEFMRQSAGATSAKTFDLAVRLRAGTEYLFRGIPRSEWTNLFEFIQAKQLRVENFREAQRGPGAAAIASYADVDDVDAGMAGISAGRDSEEEDEDFQASESEGESSSSDEDDGDGARIVDEEDVKVTKRAKQGEGKPKKTAAEGAAPKQRKPKKAKDPNAPKRPTSAFFYFSQDERARIKGANPGFGVGDVAKALGAEWKEMGAEARAPYEERARADKARYEREAAAYKASGGGAAAAADEEAAAGEEEA